MRRFIKELLVLFVAISSITFPNVVVADTLKVTFNGAGGLYGDSETYTAAVKENGTIGEENWPSDPVRSGFNFVGYDADVNATTVFTEELTLNATWEAKTTNITLNANEGAGGDSSVVATFGDDLPSIDVPFKENYYFLGYFDSEETQYYDAEGNSLITWNKEDESFELIAHYEEVELKQPILLLEDPIVTYTLTINLDGGTLVGDAPDGWTLSDTVYTKKFPKDSDLDSILEGLSNLKIEKEGYVFNNGVYSWNRDPWCYYLNSDVTLTASYSVAMYIYVPETIENCTYNLYRDKLAKNTWVYFRDNGVYDSYFSDENPILVATASSGYGIDYWTVNGERIECGDSIFLQDSATIAPHISQCYDLRVFGKLVTLDNITDILGDGTCSYDPESKTLTLSNPNAISDSDVKYFSGGIFAGDDLTIKANCNVEIYGASVNNYGGVSGYIGILCLNNLSIECTKDLIINASTSGNTSYAIYAKNVSISEGNITINGGSYGIYTTSSLMVLSEKKPYISCSANNLSAIVADGIFLNGANVYGANEEYVPGTTKSITQIINSPIIITYDTLAEQYNLWVSGVRVTEDNKDTFSNFSYEPETKTLNVFGYVFGNKGYAIYCLGDLNINVGNSETSSVTISTTNTSTYGESYGIYCTGDLKIYSDYDALLSVNSGKYAIKSVGIFCDGRLTINSKVSSGTQKLSNKVDTFAISAGTWARSGIDVEGSDPDVTYLTSSAAAVLDYGYACYGILSGDGNPGYSQEATLNVKNGKINGYIENSTGSCSSNYGVYSYGSINLDAGGIIASIDDYVVDDSSIIYSGDDMNMVNGSSVACENIAFYNDSIAIKGLEVNGTLTIDNSAVMILETTDTYSLSSVALKKYQGIYVNNLIVKGEDTYLCSYGHKTSSGDTSAIYVKRKLDIQDGRIIATAETSGDCSYGIYAGNSAFDGNHSISGGTLTLTGGSAQDGESVGLRTKKGDLDISGGILTLSGSDNGLNASGVITVTNDDNTYISAIADSKNAIYSKEPLVLNDALIENATELYVTETTSELIQNSTNPVIVRFKIRADITGVSMLYPEGETGYVYGDGVWYTGDPVATINKTGEDITNEIEEFYYEWYKKVGDDYIYINGSPFEAGDYKLVATYYSDEYEGEQVLPFSIAKKEITVAFEDSTYTYDGNEHRPVLTFDGLLEGDSAEFDVAPTYTYKDSSGKTTSAPTDVDEYSVSVTLNAGNTVTCYDIYSDDVTNNYDYSGITGTYNSKFFIFNNDASSSNIITACINKSDALDMDIVPLTLTEAKTLLSSNQTLTQAIDDGKNVIIYSCLDDVSDADAFESKDINNTNAFLFSASLYALIEGTTTKYNITNTNDVDVKISLFLSKYQASSFVGSNKNYYVYREHGGYISKLECSKQDVNDDYIFTFASDLFSDFAIFSEDKPYNPPHKDTDTNTDKKVVNTGILY